MGGRSGQSINNGGFDLKEKKKELDINYSNLNRYNTSSLVGNLNITPANFNNGINEVYDIMKKDNISIGELNKIIKGLDEFNNQKLVKNKDTPWISPKRKDIGEFLTTKELDTFKKLDKIDSWNNYFIKRKEGGKTVNSKVGLNFQQKELLLKDYSTILKDNYK